MVEKLKDEDDVYIYFNEEIEALLGYDAFEHKNFPTARRKYMKLLHPKE